ncbi:MAG: hypothetical protein IKX59_00955 [Bacteroidales bacterium]|nr:hypothetical protein [Bacteroidales bacterium]
MRQHPLPFAAMVVIVADSKKDEAVVGVVNPVLVMRLRLQEGIAGHLTLALDSQGACIKETVETNEFGKRRVGMLQDHLFDAVERDTDFAIATAACSKDKEEKKTGKRVFHDKLKVRLHQLRM